MTSSDFQTPPQMRVLLVIPHSRYLSADVIKEEVKCKSAVFVLMQVEP